MPHHDMPVFDVVSGTMSLPRQPTPDSTPPSSHRARTKEIAYDDGDSATLSTVGDGEWPQSDGIVTLSDRVS